MAKITSECARARCILWSRCSEQKKAKEKLLASKGKKIPEWVCEYPYPGANIDEDDESIVRLSRYKKDY